MRFTPTTASLALTSSRCYSHAMSPTSTRAFHCAAYRVITANNARSPVPSAAIMHKSQISSSSGISSKIQVLPFDLMPNNALQYASAFTTAVVMSDRAGNGLLRGAYHFVRSVLGFQSEFMQPRTVRWKAIYLPLWKLDHLVTLKARFSGLEYDIELLAEDSNITGTQVEPLASVPSLYPSGESMQDSLEDFKPEKHLDYFEQEALPDGEENQVKPIAIPFSMILPDLEKVYRDVVSAFRDEEVRFTGNVKSTLQAAYPLYMPFYLVDMVDSNPDYPDEAATCLVFGRGRSPSFTAIPATVFRYDTWIDRPSDFLEANVHMYPSVNSQTINSSSSNIEEMSNPASPTAFMFRKIAEGKGVAAVRECLPKVFKSFKEACTKLNSNISLTQFSRKIEGLDNVMNFKERAEGNRRYLHAVSEARTAEHEVAAAKALPAFPADIKGRVPVFMSGVGIRGLKLLNAEEAAQAKSDMITAAEKKAEAAKETLESSVPSWIRR